MLINFFKSSYLMQYILLVLLAMIIWSGSFIHPAVYDYQESAFLTPGYSMVVHLVGGNKLATIFLAFILVLSGAFLFNTIMTIHNLIPRNTLVPALVYIVLLSHSPALLTLHPALFSSLFLVIVQHYIFQVYTEEAAYSQVFNAGFLISLASLFYFSSIYLLLFIWLSFIVFRLYFWREWLIVLCGFLTPYIFLFTYYFWNDSFFTAIDAYRNYFEGLSLITFKFSSSFLIYLITGMIIFFSIWSLIWVAGDVQDKIIAVRKRYGSVFWLIFVALVSFFISQEDSLTHQVLILIPVSIFISYRLMQTKRTFWIELFFGILTLLIIVNNLTVALR